jgi:hypothetical protein
MTMMMIVKMVSGVVVVVERTAPAHIFESICMCVCFIYVCGYVSFTGAVNVSLEDSKAREEVRAYQAGVSYMDSCVGSVMNALKAKSSSSLVVTGGAASSLWDDTIVVGGGWWWWW